ncbi:hypothetical protein GGD65_000150 [Bradyrhizobium sp. CIR18]|uniref:DUF1236 domain-containing protein n=1 Tax=Bradyrhizobium sp. CIR18 TaxID=2663839 RepID=UPI001606B9EB|nr:DUF1236 domain-containing protein [Bradyrhizobium sp. CIR18]MBB4359152.1 hypothetical protein [Bradyrhizobium sp. CIR18]
MLNRFMISVATLALVAGAGLANAQNTMGRDSGGGAGGAQMQHSQPSGGAAERGATGRDSMSHDKGTVGQAGGAGTMKSDRASEDKSGAMKDERSPGGAMNKNAAEDKAGATKGQRTDERAQDKSQQDKSKSMSSDSTTKSDPAKSAKDMKAEENKAGGAAKTNNAATTDKSQTTTGTASATASAPPAEKRSEISTAIKSTKIEETTNVNFNISVGTAIPASVRVHPLPPRIVEIYPEWRGYEVIFVRGQYVIVRPQTREIVYIIEG